MTNAELLRYLGGQLSAFEPMVSALIKTHPDLAALSAALDACALVQSASTIPSTASEEFVRGQAEQIAAFRALLAAAKGP